MAVDRSNNFVKTFKSEYHLGGVCIVRRTGTLLIVSFGKDENLGVMESTNDMGAIGRIHQFLEENSSSYEAEKVINYIKKKLNA